MDLFQWLCFLGLGVAFSARDLTLRYYTKETQPLDLPSLIGPFQFVSCLFLLPIVYKMGVDVSPQTWLQPMVALAAMGKGFLIWISIFNYHKIIKESLATGAYIAPIATGGVALLNFVLFGAGLTFYQWLSIAIIAGLGWLFFLFGPLGKISATALKAFGINVIIMCCFGVMDHGVSSNANWYIYVTYASLGMLIGNLIFARKHLFNLTLKAKTIRRLYYVWIIPELLVHMVMITVLPIGLVFLGLSMRMAISMPLSAIIWKDGCPKRLLIFAISGILAMVPLIFG